jgi:hypothetical protein
METGKMVILMLRLTEAVKGGVPESAICTAKLKLPPAFGVPTIAPSLFKFSPAGREPERRLHVSGATPPDPWSVILYAAPAVPSGKEVVAIDGGTATVTELDADLRLSAADVAVILTDRLTLA